jgi:hypothetical protein
MREIRDPISNMLYAVYVSCETFPAEDCKRFGTEFEPLQLATWNYPKGQILKSHKHLVNVRTINRSQEVLICLEGIVKVKVFDCFDKKIDEYYMTTKDFTIFYKGGHGYEIMSEESKCVEVKNGPYIGKDIDKVLIKEE